MKFAQKWIVVPYHRQNSANDPCPPSKFDQIKKDLTHVLKKNTDLNSKVNEYNQVIAQHQQTIHPIVPPPPPQQTIQQPKTPYRKKLHFADEEDYDDDDYEDVFNTPSGNDPFSDIKTKSTGKTPKKSAAGKTPKKSVAGKTPKKSETQVKKARKTNTGIEEKNILNSSRAAIVQSRIRQSRLNLQQSNRSLLRDDDEVQK